MRFNRMYRILQEIYYGTTFPFENSLKEENFLKNSEKFKNNEDKINQILDARARKYFDIFNNSTSEFKKTYSLETFLYGFKMGAKLLVEIMNEEKNHLT